jgi:hypothetical protein
VIDKALGVLTGVIAKGIARGELRDLPPELVARFCVAPIVMSIIWRAVFAATDTVPFDYEKFLALHLDILMRGLAPEGSK